MAFAGGYPNSGSSGGGGTVANEDFANTLDAADSTARLALTYGTADGEVQLGDVVRQVDTGAFYMLIGSTPSNSAHWQQLSALPASIIASGQLALARGGTGADLSATGGTGQVLKQASAGGVVTVGALTAAEMPSGIDATKIGAGSVSDTEFGYLDGVTSAIQTQINGLAPPSMTTDYAPKWNGTTFVDSALQFASSNAILAGALAWDTGYNRFIGPNGTANDLYTAANGLLVFNAGGTSQRANISSTGLAVGLGTTAASAPLHVRATSGNQLLLDYSSGVNAGFAVDSGGNLTVTPTAGAIYNAASGQSHSFRVAGGNVIQVYSGYCTFANGSYLSLTSGAGTPLTSGYGIGTESGALVFQASGGASRFYSSTTLLFATSAAFGTFLGNVTAPSGTPSGGGYLYVESGALKYKGSSGTVTTLGNA